MLERDNIIGSNDTSELFKKMEDSSITNEDMASTYYGDSDGIDAILLLDYKSDMRRNKKVFVKPVEKKKREC